jgi:hypothetical protein
MIRISRSHRSEGVGWSADAMCQSADMVNDGIVADLRWPDVRFFLCLVLPACAHTLSTYGAAGPISHKLARIAGVPPIGSRAVASTVALKLDPEGTNGS